MKKSFKTLSLKKSVVSELNVHTSDVVKGGGKTQADTLCTTNAIACNFASLNAVTCGTDC